MKAADYFESIHLHVSPVDMRKQINGLAFYIEKQMGHRPFDRRLFVFSNRRKNLVKAVYWRKTGFALWMFRLEKNHFVWPKIGVAMTLSAEQLTWLLDGIDIAKIKPHPRLEYEKFS